MNQLNLRSLRARKARLAASLRPYVYQVSLSLVLVGMAVAAWGGWSGLNRLPFAAAALALLGLMLVFWYRLDLSQLPPRTPAASLDDILEDTLLGALRKNAPLTPASAWQAACKLWPGRFLINHLLINEAEVGQLLDGAAEDMAVVWDSARQLAEKTSAAEVDAGALAAALLTTSEAAKKYLAAHNLNAGEITETLDWQARLKRWLHQLRPYFGGIGRDWAAGFTPELDHFGVNVSRAIESGRAGHYHTLAHADILDSVVHNLSQGSGALALVGEAGAGKTSLAYALAQRLLEGRDESLLYYQLIELNAAQIISASGKELEKIAMTLFGEAAHASNVIIFLDDARLFFGQGTGAFDIGQVLMPLLQNRVIKIIAAFTPNEFQSLKAANEALAADFAIIAVKEPSTGVIMDILEDTALTLEQRDGLLVSFQAVREAYRLSGQYSQEASYPGKAISLLEQAVPYVQNQVMSAESVQSAVEKTRGIKVSKAEAPEADMLLHLEERIHQRMINQERAVKVVSAALRRGRAGVANPNRPVGSFLFLGPTGVGKTELARSLAATYFGDPRRMIRLDMSEYQEPNDTRRLLAHDAGAGQTLLTSIREQPFSVVLLDEVEKAHPNILNLLLQLLDEGQLTDESGKPASFKNAIVICTSNAGSAEISQQVAAGSSLANLERPLIDKLIAQEMFKAELINRFDEIVLFRPLDESELARVAMLMIDELNRNLAKQNVKVQLTKEALVKVVQAGYDPRFGARPMRRTIQKLVEDSVASRILSGQAKPGSTVTLDASDLQDGL